MPASPLADAPTPIAAPAAPAPNFGRTMGVDKGKFDDPNKHDFKYDSMRVASRFDPKQGFSPEVIDALNKELGGTYGTYYGGGDKLGLKDAKGAQDAGDFDPQDWIYAHKAQNDDTKWNFGGGAVANAEAAGAPQGGQFMGGGLPAFGGTPLDSALSGDPLEKIQQMLAQYSERPNLDALMAQLGGQ
jgi:hypothetical protein